MDRSTWFGSNGTVGTVEHKHINQLNTTISHYCTCSNCMFMMDLSLKCFFLKANYSANGYGKRRPYTTKWPIYWTLCMIYYSEMDYSSWLLSMQQSMTHYAAIRCWIFVYNLCVIRIDFGHEPAKSIQNTKLNSVLYICQCHCL